MPCRLMLGRLRKLACGVDAGVGAGVLGLSWLAILCAVLISVLAAAFWSPPEPLQDNVHSLTMSNFLHPIGLLEDNMCQFTHVFRLPLIRAPAIHQMPAAPDLPSSTQSCCAESAWCDLLM